MKYKHITTTQHQHQSPATYIIHRFLSMCGAVCVGLLMLFLICLNLRNDNNHTKLSSNHVSKYGNTCNWFWCISITNRPNYNYLRFVGISSVNRRYFEVTGCHFGKSSREL